MPVRGRGSVSVLPYPSIKTPSIAVPFGCPVMAATVELTHHSRAAGLVKLMSGAVVLGGLL